MFLNINNEFLINIRSIKYIMKKGEKSICIDFYDDIHGSICMTYQNEIQRNSAFYKILYDIREYWTHY